MDKRSIVQNSGVTLETKSMQFSTSKDTNLVLGSMEYYGFIEEIGGLTILSFSFQFSSVNGLTIKVGLKLMNHDSH